MIRSSSFVILDQDSYSSSENEDMVTSLTNTNQISQDDSVLVDLELLSSITASIGDTLIEPEDSSKFLKLESEPQVLDLPTDVTAHSEESILSLQPTAFTDEIKLPPASEDETPQPLEADSSFSNPNCILSRGLEVLIKMFELAGHLDNTSKMTAIIILLLAVLLPISNICLSSPNTSPSVDPKKFVVELEVGLENCKSALNSRQEIIGQLDQKINNIQNKLINSRNQLTECRLSVDNGTNTNKQCQSNNTALNKLTRQLEADLDKCKNALNWRQEKIDQLDTKIANIEAKISDSKKELGNCRSIVVDHMTKNRQCQDNVESITKKLKNLEASQEKMTKQIIELQDKIIHYQTESADDKQPFLVKAFDNIFGGKNSHNRRSCCKNKWHD